MFGAWSALWPSPPLLLTGPAYGLSAAASGLLGLFGLATATTAPLGAGLVDPFGAGRVVRSPYPLAALRLSLPRPGGRPTATLLTATAAVHIALVTDQTAAPTATSAPITTSRAHAVAGIAGGTLAPCRPGPPSPLGQARSVLGIGRATTAVLP
ncbi:hypothetical protein [Peterkaempfera griseoplana]|uniref:hypothetical protein n=1 Tax=Peterkaempfera griseoplana TaxID=66896 RepID=UPI0006E1C4AD|nr:hypothetical protein [Peterkaempfera griseoplana]